MIHEIAPHIFDNQYRKELPDSDSLALCFNKNKVLVRKKSADIFDLPTFKGLEKGNPDIYSNATYLFSINQQAFYLVENVEIPKGFDWETVSEIMKSNPLHLAFSVVTGYQLSNWYVNRRFCSKCGVTLKKGEKSRSLSCPACGMVEYPKIAPAVIIAVTNGTRLLLANYPKYDKYALLAGFSEIGESLEDTVRREVMEEVGLKVKNIRYYKSQPWSVSDNLLIGFFCEVVESDIINFDAEELSNAQWIEKEDISLGEEYIDGSLTFEMMELFRKGELSFI